MNAHVRESYLPVSLFTTVYRFSHPFVTDEQTLLGLMAQRGKEQYFLHKILPINSGHCIVWLYRIAT